ncbi:c-type cytochrome [Polynucleobacter acidiphobus]|uniref:c-type cytochrome n=1 Tax=Polynucleobacter acidiphobus TaxID=556053 RepID=UPI000D3568EB|nr:cytochrome c [Polynucleobacter acidiphobus]
MNKAIVTSLGAAVFAGLFSITAHAQEVKGSAKAGEAKVWLCAGCHAINDYRADWPQVYRVPKIGGQNADYIVASLKAYKSGERKHPTMRAIAGSLNDQDMADLAAYYSTQTPTSPRNPLK